MTTKLFACALLFCTAPLLAQTTYIIDQNRGPGWNFLGIQGAVDAASPGDVLLIRPGRYRGATIDKGMRAVRAYRRRQGWWRSGHTVLPCFRRRSLWRLG